MKIDFKMEGGFAFLPALNKPVTIDTTQLAPHVAKQLEFLVRESRFFNQPAQTRTAAKGAADYQTYTLTIEDGPRAHTIQLTDPIADANLQGLVAHLRTMAQPSK
ncbi:protealysin inhibitor emfourin [Hymenobacter volaticus]|uniref:Uncharacterized protein n=1 Tax=Hymenobacter volaticus TaxID=2932254 RepID=A0ABY4GFP0_9BACT|nr:protealysin inhibitor emfourin [Hymenobacter volaticus]UOQ69641.1 hypothetical protein MUN86_29535 [Hymenobacter volaticus]